MGSGAFLVAACVYLAHAYEAALVRSGACHADRLRAAGTRRHQTHDRRAMSLRRRSQSDGGPARAPVAVAGDACGRPAAELSRSPSAGRRQPARDVARVSQSAASRTRREASGIRRCRSSTRRRPATRIRQTRCRFASRLASGPNDTLEQVREKERALAALSRPDAAAVEMEACRRSLVRALVFVAGHRVPASAFGALSDAILTGSARCRPRSPSRYLARRRGDRRVTAVLPLGARVSGSVLRRERRDGSRRRASTRSSAIRRGT